MTPSSALETVRNWPVEDRLDLLFGLWDQVLAAGWRPDPDSELAAELDRRLAVHEADPANVRTWDQIAARLRP